MITAELEERINTIGTSDVVLKGKALWIRMACVGRSTTVVISHLSF